MFGGMVSLTVPTLVVIPAIYSLVEGSVLSSRRHSVEARHRTP